MYSLILTIHSLLRWLVLSSLVYTIYRAWLGWLKDKKFSDGDNRIRVLTATIAHIQLVIGLILYFISPIVNYFLSNFKDAVHSRGIRFFGMEHSIMMLVAIVFITIGSAAAKRQQTDKGKFKTMAIWLTIALVFILISIPWPFSPLAGRPYFRSSF